ncbi:MAG TPA: DUF1801 domain-containing protein, partial [Candidatus Thermoplasmatota archaeon]
AGIFAPVPKTVAVTRRKAASRTKVTTRTGPQGRPRIAKADGSAPVKAYINALQGWKRDLAKTFDDLVRREVPNVRRAVKWSSPMYGVEGQGWFAAFGAFSKHVKINFFRGSQLKPIPPAGEGKDMRSLDIRETDFVDEKKIASWVRQASKIPGWGKS